MLQVSNIVKNPRIWIAPTLASAITGPLATCVFKLQMNGAPISSGMGTCGMVGPIGVYTGWIAAGVVPGLFEWLGLLTVCLVLPAVISMLAYVPMRRAGLITTEDLSLNSAPLKEGNECNAD